jgi:hypothetical protein
MKIFTFAAKKISAKQKINALIALVFAFMCYVLLVKRKLK